MTETLSPSDVVRMRMRALGLTVAGWAGTANSAQVAVPTGEPTGAERIAGVARRMLALQGQDWRSSRWALGVRAPGTTVDDVATAFAERRIVRSWPMRGTVHVVAAEDIGWMQAATNHRVLAGAPKRRETLGMSDAALERLVDTSLAALTATPGLGRDALSQAWTDAGIDWQSSWRYHVIWWICQNGLATFGPIGPSGEPLLVRASDWIEAPRAIAADTAVAELAARYAVARGPFREADFAWWTGLTVREARAGLQAAAEMGVLTPARASDASGEEVAGTAGALWVTNEQLGIDKGHELQHSGEESPEWHLLAAFDEHLLGYTDRSAQLDAAHFERIVPGRNGMFAATVVHRGRVVGTWKRAKSKRGGLEVSPFPESRIDPSALISISETWAAFHGVPAGDVTISE